MADQWHVARDKQRLGPFTSARLRQMAADGSLLPTDMVLKAGMQKWVPASTVKGLFGPAARPEPPAPPPQPVPASTDFDDLAPAGAPTRKRHRQGTPIWIWAGGGGLGLVVASVLLVVFLSGRSTKSGPADSVAKDSKNGATSGDKGTTPRDRGPTAEFFAPKVEYAKGPKGQPLKQYRLDEQDGTSIVYTAFDEGDGVVNHGWKARFDRTGKRKLSETWYFDGYAHGPELTWHPNGKPKSKGGNKQGKPHGLFMEWFENGEPSRRRSYVDGDLHGTCTDWSEDGKCVTEVDFVKGVPQPFDLVKATRQQFEAALDMACDERRGTDREPLYLYRKRTDCDADDWFFRIFGRPASGYTRLTVGSTQNWTYQCRDGRVVLRAQSTQNIITVKVTK